MRCAQGGSKWPRSATLPFAHSDKRPVDSDNPVRRDVTYRARDAETLAVGALCDRRAKRRSGRAVKTPLAGTALLLSTALTILSSAWTPAVAEPIGISFTHRDCVAASALPTGATGVSWTSRDQFQAVAFWSAGSGCAPTIDIPVGILEWSEDQRGWSATLSESWRAALPATCGRVQIDIQAYIAGADHILDPDGLRSLVIDLSPCAPTPETGPRPTIDGLPTRTPSAVPELSVGLLLTAAAVAAWAQRRRRGCASAQS